MLRPVKILLCKVDTICLHVRHMSQFKFSTAVIIASLGSASVAQAAPMYENLAYGDSTDTVQKKLEKLFGNTKGGSRLFGRLGLNGQFKTKVRVQGLQFSLYFGWDNSGDQLRLNKVDLYSDTSNRQTLEKAYKELVVLFTEIYGKPKFNNGLPSSSSIQVDQFLAGAVWLYGSDAVALSIGKTQKGPNLVVQFMDDQPKLISTP